MASVPERVPPGHEQHGYRPVVIVARPAGARFPMVVAVPLTSQRGPWQAAAPELYPILPAGAGGLPVDSVALLDHILGIDERRLHRLLGHLTSEDFTSIRSSLDKMLEG